MKTANHIRVSDLEIVLTPARGSGWCASAPRLVGAHGQGETPEEARANIRSAIRDMLETYRLRGERPVLRRV